MQQISSFFFDAEAFLELGRNYSAVYKTATPFPHAVFDNFLPPDVADVLLKEFPDPDDIIWRDKTHEHSKKLACNDETKMAPFTRHVLSQFNSSVFIKFLEELTGIGGLISDPHFEGGGLHQIQRGGYLHIHADFNIHPILRLDRRLNLLLYLNKHWQEEYGGHLELWNGDVTKCEHKILPVFNRCVIFNTTDFAHHGHPTPLACPPERTRKSLAFYYYTNGRPEQEKSHQHSTLYKRTSGERWLVRPQAFVRKLVPPILIDFLQLIRPRRKL